MDRCILRSASFNGGGGGKNPPPKNPPPPSPAAAGSRPAAPAPVGSKEDPASGERKALLRHPSGGMARKGGGRKGSNRRVQWKDSHGKKLAEVLEFEPSDSSDSDDDYMDTCICSIM